jgi:phenylpropionate dioxygenase-like ring-hydroxylating dioxygenase large terminal subunit
MKSRDPRGDGLANRFVREETYAPTRRPVELAQTLLPDAYTAEEFFAIEQERVFGSSWVAVGCSSQVREPGQVFVAEVAGRSIFVGRNGDGELRAFYNVCRHRGARLLAPDGRRVKRFIRCPYHSWAYDLDGRCVGTPLFTGSEIPADQQSIFDMGDVKCFDRADYGLLPVAVDSWGPLVFVNLDGTAGSLSEQLGDLPDRTSGYRLDEWEIARMGHYEIAANYKLVAENFTEYYHLPWVHPGLVQVSPVEAHHRWQGAGMYSAFCTNPIAPDTGDAGWQRGVPAISGLSKEDATSARFAWLFPNVAINILPNHLFLILARAVSPRLTLETTYLLTHPESGTDKDSEQVAGLATFWDEVNREDIAVVQRVQEGLDSTPFPGGRMCYRFEEPVHRFQNMVIDRMIGLRRVPAGDDVEGAPMFATRTASPASEASS